MENLKKFIMDHAEEIANAIKLDMQGEDNAPQNKNSNLISAGVWGWSNMGTRERIEVVLQEIGIPRNIAGFVYLVDATEMFVNHANGTPLRLGKVVYPAISEKYGVTKSGVERCIHTAVARAMATPEMKNKTSGILNYHNPEQFRTPSRFISALAAAIQKKD